MPRINLKQVANFINSSERKVHELQFLENTIKRAWLELEKTRAETFSNGDTVKFNRFTNPKELIGQEGKVADVLETKVVVIIDQESDNPPYATKKRIRVPASLIDLVRNNN